ncbi:MAG: hypothetical protein AAB475_00100 [Patescibacteria group bacterium]
MVRKKLPIFLIIMVILLLGGCTETQKRTGAGAGIGALFGFVVGVLLTGSPDAGTIGAGAGALAGGSFMAMTDSKGNQLTKEEVEDVKLQLKKNGGFFKVFRIDRDDDNKVIVVQYLKPKPEVEAIKKLEE